MINFRSLCVFVLFLWATTAVAESVLPTHLFFKESSLDHVILVDKTAKKLSIYSVKDDLPKRLKTYSNVLLGENFGDKLVEGDKKTPEGVYRITRFIPDEKLAPIYGIGSYPLSYPNFLDRKKGKTGYGIWIHGVNDKEHKEFTQGCVAIQNNEMKELIDLALVNNMVVITDNVSYGDGQMYESERSQWLTYLNDYVQSWEKGDFEQFKTFIHDDFSNQKGQGASSFLNSKKQLMSVYPYKKIETTDVAILRVNNDSSVISFKQNYCAPNMLITGKKKLYVTKTGSSWSVIGEEFKNLPIDFDVKEKASHFVSEWKTAWTSKNIEFYIQHYASDFKSKNMNVESWKTDKAAKFEKTNTIDLEINDLTVRQLSPIQYKVRFKQRYQADDYSDIGFKTLILSGCPGDFKILSENWSAIQ